LGQEDLLRSPLLGIKSFRDQMLRGLTDQTAYGTVTILEKHQMETKDSNGGGKTDIPSGETHIAPVGTTMNQRTCDNYAYQISLMGGAPEIQFYWPLADRDAAVNACTDFLRRYGERLRYNEQYQFDDDFLMKDSCHLTFPTLDHPASEKEANSLKAIFSLEHQGDGRLFKLPILPMKATWITLKKYPFDQQTSDAVTGRARIVQAFQQDCWVWQAEEVNVKGQWERFYGVVGPHEIQKVAASEIEFPPSWSWTSLANGIDISLSPPGVESNEINVAVLADKLPLEVRLALRNRLGVPQQMPTQFVVKAVDGKLSMRPGMSITLKRLSDVGQMQRMPDAASQTILPLKPLATLSADLVSRQKLVESCDYFEACSFNLHDFFDITQTGRYSLQVDFTKQSGIGEGTSQEVEFDLK
jgi:hypothetical protein